MHDDDTAPPPGAGAGPAATDDVPALAPTRSSSRWWRLVAVLAAVAVTVQLAAVYLPEVPSGSDWFPGADKLQHAIAFGLPVVLIPLADTLRRRAAGRPPRARVLVLVVWVSAAHAVVSELVQHFALPGRSGDPLDVLADWSGIAVAGVAAGTALVWWQLARRPRTPWSDDEWPDRG